jgi:hypothetical protein
VAPPFKFALFDINSTDLSKKNDFWCGEQPLKESYPALYRIARNREAWVSDNMQILNEVVHWNVPFL